MIYTIRSFESERLFTKELTTKDAQCLFEMYSDHEAMKYRGSRPLQSISDADQMIAGSMINQDHILKWRLGIRTKKDHQLVGTLLLTFDENLKNQVEIGLSFGKKHWNQGYGKETLQMVETQLKKQTPITELKAWCMNENLASIRIFKNAGFSIIAQNEYPQSHLLIKKLN